MNDFLSSLRFLLLCRYIYVLEKVKQFSSQQKLILMQIIPNLIPISHPLRNLILIHPTLNLCFIHLIQLHKITLNILIKLKIRLPIKPLYLLPSLLQKLLQQLQSLYIPIIFLIIFSLFIKKFLLLNTFYLTA